MADPAFSGFVESTLDALLIFEGCKRGALPKISRRLQEFEKRKLVVSGAVFVFDEEETGIKRWTDGLSWSPSRTLGNFLVYRELDKKNGGGGQEVEEQAAGRSVGSMVEKESEGAEGPVIKRTPLPNTLRRRSVSDPEAILTGPGSLDRTRERQLVGSLTSTYRFRSDGLVKKTISLAGQHLIGYYKIEDVTSGRLRTPSSHAELVSLDISSIFLSPALFRVPPLVEVGVDGDLHYKGEADTPPSPVLRSAGGASGNRSRPASSDSAQQSRSSSPRLPPLTLPLVNSHRDSIPGSPHGRTSSFRSVNRFDPYNSRGSPNLVTFPAYPFPSHHALQQSPNQSSFPQNRPDQAYFNGDIGATSPLMSTSEPTGQWSQAAQQAMVLSRAAHANPSPEGPDFYQPRHSYPFPTEQGISPSNSSNVFAYQPPPPQSRHMSTPGHDSSSFASWTAPPTLQHSQSYTAPSSNQFSGPPSLPPPTSRSTYAQHSNDSSASSFASARSNSGQGYDYQVLSQPSYPNYALSNLPPQRGSSYAYEPRQPTGLVRGDSVEQEHGISSHDGLEGPLGEMQRPGSWSTRRYEQEGLVMRTGGGHVKSASMDQQGQWWGGEGQAWQPQVGKVEYHQ